MRADNGLAFTMTSLIPHQSHQSASRRELRLRLTQQQAVAHLGQVALTDVSSQELFDEATRAVASGLHTGFAGLLELVRDSGVFVVRSVVGWPSKWVGTEEVPGGGLSHSGYTVRAGESVIMQNAATESRFVVSPQSFGLGITSGISTVIGSNGSTFGVLSAHTQEQRDFSEHDVAFLEAVANVVSSALRRRAAEDQAEKALQILEAVVEGTTDEVFVKDLEGRFLTLNEPAARALGLPREELIGRSIHDVLPPIEAAVMLENDWIVLEHGTVETFEEEIPFASGTRHFLSTKGPYRARDGTVLGTFGIAHDITSRIRQEQELREARDYADRLIETSNAIVLVLDLDANILTFNHAAEEITGYSREEVLGRNWSMFLPRDRYPEPWKEYARLIRVGAPKQYENPIVTKSGEERMIIWRNDTLRDADEKIIGTVSFGIDVTETVAAKEHAQELEAQLHQAEKLEAIGQLAGGIAHDFNNLLLGIRGYGELALRRLERGEAGVDADLHELLDASDRAAKLTGQLLAVARRQVLQPEVIDLREVVFDMDKLLRHLIGERIELVAVCCDEAVHVEADRSRLEQIVANLAVNARDAMPDGGRLVIEVAAAPPEAPSDAKLTVTDTGSGMSEEVAARVFEPFFSTKGADGSGLGLATVHGIVTQSGGRIMVDSTLGHGSTFSVYLPLTDAVPVKAVPSARESGNGGGGESVLVAEDDPMVRSVVASTLADRGYSVASASDGATALELAAEMETLDLLVTDLVMPGLTGKETATRVRELFPDVRVLYMSGYTDDPSIHAGTFDQGTAFIQKPFPAGALSQSIRDLLEGDVA
ncbi:MAG: PAS domain S-box protein [Gaiellaceae bacterium]